MKTKTVEMIVGLKVPDATAMTALQTLQKIGFNKIRDVKRADYYKFLIEGDADKFKNKISKVDILVNANKHFFAFKIKKNASPEMSEREPHYHSLLHFTACIFFVIVKNINDDGSSILSTLKNRLGFKHIKNVEKSTLWSLDINANESEGKKIADKAAKDLLVNENYQEYEIL